MKFNKSIIDTLEEEKYERHSARFFAAHARKNAG
jgi:hypothetical protein